MLTAEAAAYSPANQRFFNAQKPHPSSWSGKFCSSLSSPGPSALPSSQLNHENAQPEHRSPSLEGRRHHAMLGGTGTQAAPSASWPSLPETTLTKVTRAAGARTQTGHRLQWGEGSFLGVGGHAPEDDTAADHDSLREPTTAWEVLNSGDFCPRPVRGLGAGLPEDPL